MNQTRFQQTERVTLSPHSSTHVKNACCHTHTHTHIDTHVTHLTIHLGGIALQHTHTHTYTQTRRHTDTQTHRHTDIPTHTLHTWQSISAVLGRPSASPSDPNDVKNRLSTLWGKCCSRLSKLISSGARRAPSSTPST